MCQFFSGLITKQSCIWDYDKDSHEELIVKSGFKDTSCNPNFVRVELLPKDDNIYNHKITNWKLKIDQDYKPDWFDFDGSEKRMKVAIKKVFKKRFILDGQNIKEIRNGRYYISGGTIKDFWNGTIKYISGGTIENFRNGTIKNFWNGTIEDFRNGTIKDFWNGTIEYISGGTIKNFWNGTIKDFRNGTIKDFWNGTIKYISGGTIEDFRNGTIENFIGGTIEYFWNGIIKIYTTIDVIQNIEPGAIVIDRKNKLIYTKEKYKILHVLKG